MAKSIGSDHFQSLLVLVWSLRAEAGPIANRSGGEPRPQTFVSKVELGERGLDAEELRLLCNALDQDFLAVVERWLSGLNADEQPRRGMGSGGAGDARAGGVSRGGHQERNRLLPPDASGAMVVTEVGAGGAWTVFAVA